MNGYRRNFSEFIDNVDHFAEILTTRAAKAPDRVLYRYLGDGENESVCMTYGQLDQKARGIAGQLLNVCRPGDRALLLFLPDLDYITGFMGCLYAGVIAVPAYPPDPSRLAQTLPKLKAISDDAGATIALSTRFILSFAKELFAAEPELEKIQWLATDDMVPVSAGHWQLPDLKRENLAFLQYTSGSTGIPKGVMVSHGNLIENAKLIKAAFEDSSGSFGVSWLPPYHDMGLIGGILQPIYLGATTVLMSPLMFLQKPFRWLSAISKYRATTSGGPNFAYDLCVRKISPDEKKLLDLSTWKVAFNGAEPVRAETLKRFEGAFRECGFQKEAFYPCYGMAETTLFASGGQKGALPETKLLDAMALKLNRIENPTAAGGDIKTLIGCGQAKLPEKIVIADPDTRRRCPEGTVGEIWVSGPNITQGYWNRSDETGQTFGAYLSGTGEGPFLKTGDLGFIENAELYVTGRIKDMIIVRGRNHYPQDIERAAEKSHPALRPGCGAAFSATVEGEERLVVVFETQNAQISEDEANCMIRAMREAVLAAESLSVYAVCLLKPRSIPKTSSGKLRRHDCKEGFQADTLETVAKWRETDGPKSADSSSAKQRVQPPSHPGFYDQSVESIAQWLMERLAKALRIPPSELDPRIPFSRYGLDSAEAVGLAGDLEKWLGKRLPPTLAYDYPTIESLAEHLADVSNPVSTEFKEAIPRDPAGHGIAVIGMGCRFPGADSPEAFWRLVINKVNAVTEVPEDRWRKDDFYAEKRGAPGKMNTKWGGFLKNVDQFDSPFFGISPREAAHMDPQQRLLLEVVWESLENAGIPSEKLDDSMTGVFIGISGSDYSRMHFNTPAVTDAYAGPGNALCIAANRISYLLNLHGPSWAIDTACSSSLVAIHQACRSLRQGECTAAIAGGVNMVLTPQITISFSQAGMMAADGKCKSFDADADGYVRGEGCGVVILKRLADALAEGDEILAVIRGTAVNQDGRSSSMTAPNGPAQQKVIKSALADAGVAAARISYVEAHGTGTAIGDPIELGSLKQVLLADRHAGDPCWIGSVKPNIGHLEAASGIAGLIKVIMSLRHAVIAPNIHYHTPTPHVSIENTMLAVPTGPIPWPGDKRRLAGISSFGFGGTNAHMIVEESPVNPHAGKTRKRPHHLLTLSAKSEAALHSLAGRYVDFLAQNLQQPISDLCYCANVGRSHFPHRLCVAASSIEEISRKLAAYRDDGTNAGIITGMAKKRNAPVAFLFTGQGSQYAGMAKSLFDTQSVFRKTLEECDALLSPHLPASLLEVIFSKGENAIDIHRTGYTQPALFAVEYGLARLWQSFGIEPAAVMGHSVGEYVAACIADVFSLEEGLRLIAARGRLMQELPEGGAMAAVLGKIESIEKMLEAYSDDLGIAAFNGPDSLVISGEKTCLEKVLAEFSAVGIRSKRLAVSHAFHSKLMRPMLDQFFETAGKITYNLPKIPLISNITGKPADKDIAAPDYWRRHILSPVRFFQGMESLHQMGMRTFLECGPDPVLLGMGRRCIEDNQSLWLPSLRREKSDWLQLLNSLGELYVRGAAIRWEQVDREYAAGRVRLPNYPFQRKRYWIQGHEAAPAVLPAHPTMQSNAGPGHPLLGSPVSSAILKSGERLFESVVRPDSPEYLNDHKIFDHVIFPAAGYLEMAMSAGSIALGSDAVRLEKVVFHRALILDEDDPKKLQVVLSPESHGHSFKIFSAQHNNRKGSPRDEVSWMLHASGEICAIAAVHEKKNASGMHLPDKIKDTSDQEIPVDQFYGQLGSHGLNYGITFRGIEKLWRENGNALGKIGLPEKHQPSGNYMFSPPLLDACFQSLAGTLNERAKGVFLPVGIDRMEVRRNGNGNLWCRAGRMTGAASDKILKADLDIWDMDGKPVAMVEGLSLQQVEPGMLVAVKRKPTGNPLYNLSWEPRDIPREGSSFDITPGIWILLSDRDDVGRQIAAQLEKQGASCIIVTRGETFHRAPDNRHYVVNPESQGDFREIFRHIKAGSLPVKGIVHLWPLDSTGDMSDELTKSSVLGCDSLLYLVRAAASSGLSEIPRLWVATRGSCFVTGAQQRLDVAQAPLWGLCRVIALEYPSLRCTRIDLDPMKTDAEDIQLFESLLHGDGEDQIAFRNNRRYAARLAQHEAKKHGRLEIPESSAYRLATSGYGILENLCLVPDDRRLPGPDEVEIRVRASGLNFRDVLNALGMLREFTRELGIDDAEALPFGGECAGVVVSVGDHVKRFKPGDEVIAAFAVGSLAGFVCVNQSHVAAKPPRLNFEQAATLPIAFITACYGLSRLAGLKPGEKVLIHAATGGVGQAAVQFARMIGAEIFATASPGKWDFLKAMGIRHVMNSRTLDFAREISEKTGGRGVDVVFNSLNGDFIEKSLSVLAENGRFVEIGKIGIWSGERMRRQRPDVSYLPFDLIEVSRGEPDLITEMLSDIMARMAENQFNPLPSKIFPIQDAVDAFRFMAQAKHIGKVVISFSESGNKISGSDKKIITDDASYLITGGYGALGLKAARRLVEKGARCLVLAGRRGPSAEAEKEIRRLTDQGARIMEAAADVSKFDDMSDLMKTIDRTLPPLKGIVHAAGILADGMLENLSRDTFEKVMSPKVKGAWNLHVLTRDRNLDFFVLFSSAASLLGSPGQGNYASANAFMDALAHLRCLAGIPAKSINWGPWSGAGMAAETIGANPSGAFFNGMDMIDPDQGFDIFERLLTDPTPQVGVLPIYWPAFLKRFAGSAVPPVFKHFAEKNDQGGSDIPRVLKKLSDASAQFRFDALSRYLMDRVAHVLDLSSTDAIDPKQPLKELGLDSLMAVELNNMIQNDLIVGLTAEHFMENPSIHQLAASLLKVLGAEGLLTAKPEDAGNTGIAPGTTTVAPGPNGWVAYRKPKPSARVNLFCFHHMGGAASLFRGWGEDMPESIDVCPVQLPGREGRRHEKPEVCFNHLIDSLSDALIAYLDRPFAFFGHSMGTWIAFELAHAVRQKYGKNPEHLFVGAMPPPSRNQTLFEGFSMDDSWLAHMEIPDVLKKDKGFMNEWLNLFQADSTLFHSFGYSEKPPFDCPITAFGGLQDTLVSKSELSRWQRHTAGCFHMELLSGGHMFPVESKDKMIDIIKNSLLSPRFSEIPDSRGSGKWPQRNASMPENECCM